MFITYQKSDRTQQPLSSVATNLTLELKVDGSNLSGMDIKFFNQI